LRGHRHHPAFALEDVQDSFRIGRTGSAYRMYHCHGVTCKPAHTAMKLSLLMLHACDMGGNADDCVPVMVGQRMFQGAAFGKRDYSSPRPVYHKRNISRAGSGAALFNGSVVSIKVEHIVVPAQKPYAPVSPSPRWLFTCLSPLALAEV